MKKKGEKKKKKRICWAVEGGTCLRGEQYGEERRKKKKTLSFLKCPGHRKGKGKRQAMDRRPNCCAPGRKREEEGGQYPINSGGRKKRGGDQELLIAGQGTNVSRFDGIRRSEEEGGGGGGEGNGLFINSYLCVGGEGKGGGEVVETVRGGADFVLSTPHPTQGRGKRTGGGSPWATFHACTEKRRGPLYVATECWEEEKPPKKKKAGCRRRGGGLPLHDPSD